MTGSDLTHSVPAEDGNGVSNTALRFHFDLRGTGRVNLILTIPPGDRDDSTRRALFDMAQQHDDVFNPRGDSLGGRYTTSWIRLHASEPILSEEELVNWNREVASQKILAWVVKFAAGGVPSHERCHPELFRESR